MHARLIPFIFFLSGATGLLYEVLWSKYLGFILGHAAYAEAMVLATFLGGLALGNAWLGRWADRVPNTLRLYGWLEIGIGLLAGISPAVLGGLQGAFVQVAQGSGLAPGVVMACKVAVALVALLPPTLLMGGSLPALGRFLTRSMGTLKARIAGLYFLNSAGAVLGTLAAGFWLIPRLGLDAATAVGAFLNVGIGLVALYLAGRQEPQGASAPVEEPEDEHYSASQVRAVQLAVFVSGLVSLSYEVVWIRLLSLVMGASTYSFSLMLSAFIAGIALGSLIVLKSPRWPGNALIHFAIAELAVAIAVLATLPLYERLPYEFLVASQVFARVPEAYPYYEGLKLVFCFALMLVPTTFLGMTLPLASRVATSSLATIGRGVGSIFSLNTLGNVIGAVTAGLVLMPWLGAKGLLFAGVAVNVAIAACVLATTSLRRPLQAAAVAVPALALAVTMVVAPNWDPTVWGLGVYRQDALPPGHTYEAFRAARREALKPLFVKDDAHSTVMVAQYNGEINLAVNGKADGSSHGDLGTQLLSGQLPMLLHPDAREVMVIGFGTGITAGSVLTHPDTRVDMIEISAAVLEAGRHFGPFNHQVLDNARMTVIRDDAMSHLQLHPKRFDLIVSEPSNPWIAGIGNLFSVEAYRQMAERLTPDGFVVQWMHTYETDDENFKLVLRTFREVFPHVTIWQPHRGDFVMVGGRRPLAVDFGRMAERMAHPEVKSELARLGLKTPAGVLALQAMSEPAAAALAGEGPLNRTRFPRLEYRAPYTFFLRANATAPFAADQRFGAGSGLLLDRYLAARGQALGPEEFAEIYAFQAGEFGNPRVAEQVLAAWAERYPADARPGWLQANAWHSAGRQNEAIARLASLAAAHPKNVELAERLAELTFERLAKRKNALGQPAGDLAAALEAHERLFALTPGRDWGEHVQLAMVYKAGLDYPRSLAESDQAVALMRGQKPLEATLGQVLLDAARTALAVGDRARAAGYLKAVPAGTPARAEAEALLRAQDR